MRGVFALAATALVLAACGGGTDTPTSKTEAVTTASPTSLTTSSSATPTLVPGGWGDIPPSRDAIEQMAQWAPPFVPEVKATYDESAAAIDRFEALQKSPDVNAATAGCQDMTRPIDIKLAPHLPTPDPDLTNALQVVIDDAGKIGTSCAKAITAPSTANEDDFHASVDKLWRDFDAVGDIMIRDGKILTAAGF